MAAERYVDPETYRKLSETYAKPNVNMEFIYKFPNSWNEVYVDCRLLRP